MSIAADCTSDIPEMAGSSAFVELKRDNETRSVKTIVVVRDNQPFESVPDGVSKIG